MRIAVLADIHANLLALDAVLADIGRRGADRLVNLGDSVSGPLWPGETAARLMSLDMASVRGNHDRVVATLDPAAMGSWDRPAHDALTAGQRDWLRHLPQTADVAPGVLAFHATPACDDLYLLEEVRHGALAQRTGGHRRPAGRCRPGARRAVRAQPSTRPRVPAGRVSGAQSGKRRMPSLSRSQGAGASFGDRIAARALCDAGPGGREQASRRVRCRALRLGRGGPARRSKRACRVDERLAHGVHERAGPGEGGVAACSAARVMR